MGLIDGLGGVSETRVALASFRAKPRAAGAGELHLNAVVWGLQILPGAAQPSEVFAVCRWPSFCPC